MVFAELVRSKISIHAPRAGSDLVHIMQVCRHIDFNPRSPCGERPCFQGQDCPLHKDFNPRSPCGERQDAVVLHALADQFQSTLPVRGATWLDEHLGGDRNYFNPRSPCGERRQSLSFMPLDFNFNPRSPCGERLIRSVFNRVCEEFQSTLPVRGATDLQHHLQGAQGISIHAPRAGSDGAKVEPVTLYTDFNPRSPCGERPALFQGYLESAKNYFNPRSPCGERPV